MMLHVLSPLHQKVAHTAPRCHRGGFPMTQTMKTIDQRKMTNIRTFLIQSPTAPRAVLEMRSKETQIATIPYQDRDALLCRPVPPHPQPKSGHAEIGRNQINSALAPTTLDGDGAKHEGNEKLLAIPCPSPLARPKNNLPPPR